MKLDGFRWFGMFSVELLETGNMLVSLLKTPICEITTGGSIVGYSKIDIEKSTACKLKFVDEKMKNIIIHLSRNKKLWICKIVFDSGALKDVLNIRMDNVVDFYNIIKERSKTLVDGEDLDISFQIYGLDIIFSHYDFIHTSAFFVTIDGEDIFIADESHPMYEEIENFVYVNDMIDIERVKIWVKKNLL